MPRSRSPAVSRWYARDCPELIRQLKALPGIQNVTLTTNGVELARQMTQLAQAGVDAINISLDTLDAAEFAHITRRDMLPQVLEGIRAAQAFPQVLLKLNVVPIAEQDETCWSWRPWRGSIRSMCALLR